MTVVLCTCKLRLVVGDRPRFFDQVGHQTTNASIGNRHFFTILSHWVLFLNDKVLSKSKFSKKKKIPKS